MNKKEHDLEFSKKENDVKLEKSLDKYSYWLIKVVGVVGIIMGLAILGAFWYWVIKMLFKIGA
jgi:hypothetical protein